MTKVAMSVDISCWYLSWKPEDDLSLMHTYARRADSPEARHFDENLDRQQYRPSPGSHLPQQTTRRCQPCSKELSAFGLDACLVNEAAAFVGINDIGNSSRRYGTDGLVRPLLFAKLAIS